MTTAAQFFELVQFEAQRAEEIHGPAASMHEAYAILLEELDELWDEVKKKHHDYPAMTEELIQLAAMCWKAQEVINRRSTSFG